jgi:hypothetical protein
MRKQPRASHLTGLGLRATEEWTVLAARSGDVAAGRVLEENLLAQ